MGAQQSSDGLSDAQSPFDSIPAEHRSGWKVLSVSQQSPSGGKGLVPYFSVLTHINGHRLGEEESALVPLIREGVELRCTFLNLSTLQTREIAVTPARGPHHEGLLGLMIRWDRFSNAHLETIHCLEVHHGSPAESAGLRAHADYLLGTPRMSFRNYEHLDQFLAQHNNVQGTLLVFNKATFSVREVKITPSQQWGGNGSLGCDVGFGFLHQLPIDGRKEVTYEGDATSGSGDGQHNQQQHALPQQAAPQQDQQQQLQQQQPFHHVQGQVQPQMHQNQPELQSVAFNPHSQQFQPPQQQQHFEAPQQPQQQPQQWQNTQQQQHQQHQQTQPTSPERLQQQPSAPQQHQQHQQQQQYSSPPQMPIQPVQGGQFQPPLQAPPVQAHAQFGSGNAAQQPFPHSAPLTFQPQQQQQSAAPFSQPPQFVPQTSYVPPKPLVPAQPFTAPGSSPFQPQQTQQQTQQQTHQHWSPPAQNAAAPHYQQQQQSSQQFQQEPISNGEVLP